MTWNPPSGPLGTLTEAAHDRARALGARQTELEQSAAVSTAAPSFSDSLGGRSVAVIAEIKRRSPSKGVISEAIDARSQAKAYADGGASAISVLTEPLHFGGSTEDMLDARAAGLPLLRKDFHVHPIQLLEARALGASAALLIVRALGPGALEEMLKAARDLQLEVLVEVRTIAELDRALAAGAGIIGVNNRDLETLQIDPGVSAQVIPRVPRECIAVAESGVRAADDVRTLARSGADAVLVGSVLSASSDPAEGVRALTGIARQMRDA